MSTSTVSGFSLGGVAAETLTIIYSSEIKGVGTFAGGIYGHYIDYWNFQDKYPYPNTEALERARKFESEGTIDPLSNMNNKAVWLHWGNYDSWKAKRGDEDQPFMNALGADLTWVTNNVGHAMPSLWGDYAGSIDGFGLLFTNLFSKIDGSTPNAASSTPENLGVFREFDQREFVDAYIPWEWHGLNDRGFVFYPHACKTAGSNCKVHMYLHGCGAASITKIGTGKADVLGFKNDGVFQHASTNNMVVIVPQARISAWPNDGECWDGVGMYQWDLSHTKINPQYRALKRMFDRVASAHGSVQTDYNANNIYTMTSDELANKYSEWVFVEFASWSFY